MTVHIEPRGEASEEMLAEIEHEIGQALPADYRRWLRATNGGFIPEGATLPEVPLYLTHLVAAVGPDGRSPLMSIRRSDEYLTADYLRLNRIDSGMLALKLSEPRRGSVWYLGSSDMGYEYDHEDEGYESERPYICAELLIRVTDSFDELLNKMVPVSEQIARESTGARVFPSHREQR